MNVIRAGRRVAAKARSRAVRAGSSPRLLRWGPYARTWARLVGRLDDVRLRAQLLTRQAQAELARGQRATVPLAVAAQLVVADRHLAAGSGKAAATAVDQARRLLFDRRLHFDGLSSPLAEDPAGYLRPWHASAAVRALSAPRGRRVPAVGRPTDRPVRVLIATYGNHGFLASIRRHLADRADVELRFIDPGIDGEHVPLLGNPITMMDTILAGGSTPFREQVAGWLQPHVDWADVAFVDWAAGLSVLAGLVDPGPTRMVVRLHSFEIFTLWPHLLDPSRIDDFVFVSDVLLDFTLTVLPALAAAPTRTHVITNAMDLRAFAGQKPADARFNVGVVGLKALAKDPRWALEVLRHLRASDARYRMSFYGKDMDPEASPTARAYWDALQADIAALEPGALTQHGHRDDMPVALREVGVILSSSVRESFHCALAEGAASGAIPVVRDWPFFAGRKASARTLFPADWVVETPAEAANRIVALTQDESTWRAAGAAASAHAITNWDWETVRPDFDRVLLGTEATAPPPAG